MEVSTRIVIIGGGFAGTAIALSLDVLELTQSFQINLFQGDDGWFQTDHVDRGIQQQSQQFFLFMLFKISINISADKFGLMRHIRNNPRVSFLPWSRLDHNQ